MNHAWIQLIMLLGILHYAYCDGMEKEKKITVHKVRYARIEDDIFPEQCKINQCRDKIESSKKLCVSPLGHNFITSIINKIGNKKK